MKNDPNDRATAGGAAAVPAACDGRSATATTLPLAGAAPPAWARRLASCLVLRRALVVGAVVVAAAFVAGRFGNLAAGDFRHWDESLYAWRAKVAVATGEWGDQSDWSFNTFYSGSFPPLLVWEMAAMMAWAGDVEWAARLPVAVHGALALLGLGALGWMLGGPGAGWLALCLLGAIAYFTRYSRAAQFDVPAVSWMILALAAYVASVRWPARRRLWVVASGAALGCGLMTKIAVSAFVWPALVATVVVWWAVGRSDRPAPAAATDDPGAPSPPPAGDAPAALLARHAADRGAAGLVADQLVLGGVAAAIWLPWHVWMGWRHGDEFWNWYLGYHLLDRTAMVLDHHAGAWWFYVGAAYDRLPPALWAFGWAAWAWGGIVAWRAVVGRGGAVGGARADAVAVALPWLWLTTLGALFQASETKREIYLLVLYPAIALLAALFVARAVARPATLRTWWLVLVAPAFFELLSRDAGRAYTLGMYLSGQELPPPGTTIAAEALLVARPHLLGAAAIAAVPALAFAVARFAGGGSGDDHRPPAEAATAPGAPREAPAANATAGAGAGARAYAAPNARAAWWAHAAGCLLLAIFLAISLWRQGLRSMLEPDMYDRDQKWQQVRPWLQDEARYPFVAFVGDGEGPQFMYYLNGNYRDSIPLPTRPIGRFFDLEDERLARYRRPGSALIVSAFFAGHQRERPEWGELVRGWRLVQEGPRFLVFEWEGGDGAATGEGAGEGEGAGGRAEGGGGVEGEGREREAE